MTPSETSALIEKAGGPAEFGRLIGIDTDEGWQQRVNNWLKRGLPAKVELDNYETIQRLRGREGSRRRSSSS